MIRSLLANFQDMEATFAVRRNLDMEQLEAEIASGNMLWIDLVDPTPKELQWLATQFNLNPLIVDDLKRQDRRPSLVSYKEYLFLSLFQPRIHLNDVMEEEVHCIVTKTAFITTRSSKATAVDSAYDRVAKNSSAWHYGVAYCLYLTAQHIVDSYYPLLDRISLELDQIEETLMRGQQLRSARQPIYAIKQQLILLRQMVAPQREVLSNLVGEKRVTENTDIRDLFRHLYERLLRIYDVIDAQRDLAANILDMIQNMESQRLVEAVNRLTIFSMIFLPLSFFLGLFELGFARTLDVITLPISGRVMFAMVMAAMVGSVLVMLYTFRRQHWL